MCQNVTRGAALSGGSTSGSTALLSGVADVALSGAGNTVSGSSTGNIVSGVTRLSGAYSAPRVMGHVGSSHVLPSVVHGAYSVPHVGSSHVLPSVVHGAYSVPHVGRSHILPHSFH